MSVHTSRLSLKILSTLMCALFWTGFGFAQSDDDANDNAKQRYDCSFKSKTGNTFCLLNETRLPLRLLTKPRVTLFENPDLQSAKVKDGLATFTELIATDVKDVSYDGNSFAPEGWFGVTYTAGRPRVGWIPAQDIVEWHHGLILTYTNPGVRNRQPVIMFDQANAITDTLDQFEGGGASPEEFFKRIADKDIPLGVISREPSTYIDFKEKFYLMPIIGKQDVSSFLPDGDAWALQFAAATDKDDSRSGGACDIKNSEVDCDKGKGSLDNLKSFEIVFVVDMSLSMQPFIDAVRNAVTGAAQTIRTSFPADSEKIRFGIVGYRDDVAAVPQMEWTTKDFTKNELLNTTEFLELMKSGKVAASRSDNGDFPEDVFAGVRDGVETAWSDEKGVRLLVLIGDASSHPLDHPRNTSGQSAETIRKLADQNDVTIAALHISKNALDASIAEKQFRTIVSYAGESKSYSKIAVGQLDDEGTALEESLRENIRTIVGAISGGDVKKLNPENGKGGAVLAAARAAVVDYLGNEASPPTNIVAWALDRDLADLSKKSFSVKVMVDRRQIEELKNGLSTVLTAFQRQESTTGDFFAGAQGMSTGTTMDLLGVTDTTKLGKASILPKWIAYLPYKSQIMSMSVQDFKDSPPDDRRRMEERLERLINAYDVVLNTPSFWRTLNDEASGDDRVHFIDLAELP